MPNFSVTFPELKLTRGDMLLSHGVTPSVCVAYSVAEPTIAKYGDLVFGDGTTPIITFRDCAIDQYTMTPPGVRRGFRYRVLILDRRWKWKHCLISGRYNVRLADGSIKADTKKTYKELLEIILKEMGEEDYEIKLHSDDLEPPEVEWSRQRADAQLAYLCDRIGCLVVLRLNNAIKIVPYGEGPIYPQTGMELNPALDTYPSAIPKYVRAILGPTKFQTKIRLEAVGVDTDGSIKPIDELTYKPDSGWEFEIPGTFSGVATGEERQLACDTVYRWYRVKEFSDKSLDLPVPEYTITTINDILPLLPDLADVSDDTAETPFVEGFFFNSDLKGINEEDSEFARFDDEFELDTERGIVKFPYPMFWVYPDEAEDAGHQGPADLYLTAAFHARKDPISSRWHDDYKHEIDSQAEGRYGDAHVEHLDVFRCLIQRFNDLTKSDLIDSKEDTDAQARALAEAHALIYSAIPTMSMQWNGIYPIDLDGNVHMLRWMVGGKEGTTWGGKNLEYHYQTMSRSERRLRGETARRLHL
jgi:hypothetical protein